MITTANEFETIPAFTSIAGDTLGTCTQREIACEMLKVLETASSVGCSQLWQDIATTTDDDQYLIDIQADLSQAIQDNCPLPDYCTVELQDGEWLVLPYVDDDLPRLEDTPDNLATIDGQTAYDILVVNDHGNVDFKQWDHNQCEYVTQWAMV